MTKPRVLRTAAVLAVLTYGGLSVGCAAKHQLRCRYTMLDAKFKPIKPHAEWHTGITECMSLIENLALMNAPETFGVEAKGPLRKRELLYQLIKPEDPKSLVQTTAMAGER